MEIIELLMIAVGVSMDAFAVSICKGLSVNTLTHRHTLITGLWFGGFQALMPLIGYYAGVHFSDFVTDVDHWIAFALLGIIGVNMIRDARADDCSVASPDFSFRTMLIMAVATSIDALAIGISLAFLKVDIWLPVLLIGITTALFSITGVRIGHYYGSRYKSAAEITGGIILILIGSKILIEHTLL